jgi:hypothetical protein
MHEVSGFAERAGAAAAIPLPQPMNEIDKHKRPDGKQHNQKNSYENP